MCAAVCQPIEMIIVELEIDRVKLINGPDNVLINAVPTSLKWMVDLWRWGIFERLCHMIPSVSNNDSDRNLSSAERT